MSTRSNSIARRWFWIVGLLVAVFVIGVAAVLLWPDDGRLVAVSDEAHAEANAENDGEPSGAAAEEADTDPDEPDAQRANAADGWFSMSQASAGAEAYDQHCAQCHGIDLEGGTGTALAGDTFWQRWDGETVHAFFEVTRQTMPQGNPGSLSAETYADITAHVLHVNDFPPGESELPPEADHLQTLVIERAATEWDAADANGVDVDENGEDADAESNGDAANGWFTDDQAERGSEPYAQHCAQCHGDDLQGDPPLVGEQFHASFETVWDLFDYTRSQMPQGEPGSLDDETYADITAFVLRENDFSAGDEELEADDEDRMRDMPLDASEAENGEAENGEAEDVDAENGEVEEADAENGEAEEPDERERDAEVPAEQDRRTDEADDDAPRAATDDEGWFSEAQVRAGAFDFSQHCARCHGAGLQGDPPLMGGGFPERWTTVWELYQYVRQTMPQDAPGLLDDRTYVDTVAYMLSENGYPTGEHRLTTMRSQLIDMRLDPSLADAPDAASRNGDEANGEEPDDAAADANEADANEADADEVAADANEADANGADADENGEDADANGSNDAADDDTAESNGDAANGWFTDDQAERGSEPYAQHCAQCHGDDLQGDPPLVGEQFHASFETVWDLFDYTRSQMPQGEPGSLDDETYADITAFVLRENDFSAGDEELEADDEDRMRDMPLDASEAENGEAENGEVEEADAENGEADDAEPANAEAENAEAERDGPAPGRAWLELETRPENVTINVIGPGGFTGRAIGAQTLQDLRPGLYVIAASRGHQSVMTTVVLGSGETGTVSLVLDELSRSGDVPRTPGTGEAELPAIPRRPADDALIGEAPSATPDTGPMRDDENDDIDADGDTDRDQDQDRQLERTGLHMRQVTEPRDDGSDVRPGGQLQSERGQHAYALHCARCHGVDLEGNVAPALGGEVFLERWQGHPVDWLYFQARASMPPHGPGTLSEQTYADIIVFALTEAGVLDGHEGFRPNDEAFRMLTIAPRGAALEDRTELEESVERLRETLHEPHDGVTLDGMGPLSPIEWPDDLGTAPIGYPGRLDAAAATEVGDADDGDVDEDDEDDEDDDDANALPASRRTAGTG